MSSTSCFIGSDWRLFIKLSKVSKADIVSRFDEFTGDINLHDLVSDTIVTGYRVLKRKYNIY